MINDIVKTLRPDQFDQWDNFVDSSPQGDLFCYSWWLNTITKGDFKILAIVEQNKIVAGIPLAYIDGEINEPPLTRTLGPLYKNLDNLIEHDKITLQRKWLNLLLDQIPLDSVVQFCTSHNITDWLPFRWRGFKQMTRYTYLINYSNKTIEDLWKSLSTNKKRDIIKAKKYNLRVENSENFELFYNLVEQTYKRQNLTYRFSIEDYKLLDEVLKNNNKRKIFVVFDERNQIHAAIYIVYNSKSAYFLLSGSYPELRHNGGATLALWEAIKYFSFHVEYFNFGGSNINHIENYIRGFGGDLTPYFHIFNKKPEFIEVERIKVIEVDKEVAVLPLPPPDDWKYHVKLILQHSLILVKKSLYKIHIRFKEPVKVSVITACFNHGKYIHEMLDSVLQQTYQNFEVIIINDGSTDNSSNILNKIKHKKVKVIHTENFGPAHARNHAIKHTKGEFIINLDADDKITPTFIQQCVEIISSHPNVGIVYSNVELFGYQNGPFVLQDYSFENMLRANCIVANACFRKSDWKKTEGYSSEMKFGNEDFDFWLSILELGQKVFQIKEPLMFYRTYENQKDSRSGRLKENLDQMEEVIVQAFQRHKKLYEKVPHIYVEFSEKESQFDLKRQLQINDPAHPVFSIITPTNLRPQLLKRAIESVIKQSFSNWEQIVVDDANDPNTAEILAKINDTRIKYIVHDNPKGAAGAYNTGIKNAHGKYINFLDDDDEYLPGILEKLFSSFNEATKKPDFVWTGITRVKDTANGEEIINTQVWPARFHSKEAGLMVSTAIGNGFGLSVKKECIEEIGLYDEEMKVGVDTDFMIRLSEKYNFSTVPEVLVKIHHHISAQLTHERNNKIRCENYRRIIDRHFNFLSGHWDTYYMHNKVYASLCYQLNEKNAGRKTMWKLIKKFPSRRINWLDLLSFELYGKGYIESNLKIFVQDFNLIKFSGSHKINTANKLRFWFNEHSNRKEVSRSINKLDIFRKNYDNMSFNHLVKKANIWLHEYPEQASYDLSLVQKWFIEYVSDQAFVLEIGGWRGDLADAILKENSAIQCWDNYDVISDSSTQKCKDPRYHHIPLNDYIWNLNIDAKYNALIATHMIEHIKWRELIELIHWIPDNIQTVLFEISIVQSAENYDWTGHNSTNIIEKGWQQVIEEMEKMNFVRVFYENDTVIFKRDSSLVYIISGKTRQNNIPLSIAYAGNNHNNMLHWASMIIENPNFNTNICTKNRLIRFIKTQYPECSMLLLEQDSPEKTTKLGQNSLLIPRFINTTIDISMPMEALRKKNRSGFDRIRRWIYTKKITCEFTQSAEAQKEFYYNMYLPFIKKRYSECAFILEYEGIFSDTVKSEILFIKKDDKAIAGAVIRFWDGRPTLGFIGVKEEYINELKRWNTGAVYYFIAEELHKRGFEKLHLGGSPSFLNNGLLFFKMRLTAQIDIDQPFQNEGCVSFHLLKDNEGIRDFLTSNPFVYVKQDGFLAGVLWTKFEKYLSFEKFEKEISPFFRLGLDECHIFKWGKSTFPKEWIDPFLFKKIIIKSAEEYF
ncbi:MAG: peptidoglycan bridge formation glycyltransferase FemA/FemB family protein [Bacteroidota bacterium]